MKNECYKYAKRILSRKSYFISELRNKLLKMYDVKDVNKTIKALINEDLLNDQKLIKIYIYDFINFKNSSKMYIKEYFQNKKISISLVNLILNSYPNSVFEKNKKIIISILKERNKNEKYINDYLIRKGFEID